MVRLWISEWHANKKLILAIKSLYLKDFYENRIKVTQSQCSKHYWWQIIRLWLKPYKNTHHIRESFFIVIRWFGPIVWMLIFRILFAYFSSCKTHHHSQNYVKLLLKWSVTTELALMKHQMGRMQIISFSSVFLSHFKKRHIGKTENWKKSTAAKLKSGRENLNASSIRVVRVFYWYKCGH